MFKVGDLFHAYSFSQNRSLGLRRPNYVSMHQTPLGAAVSPSVDWARGYLLDSVQMC